MSTSRSVTCALSRGSRARPRPTHATHSCHCSRCRPSSSRPAGAARRHGFPWATSSWAWATRTIRAIPPRASSSSTPAASARPRSCFPTAGRCSPARPGSSPLLLGSHLDSVRDAGKYDGPLGVMVAIAAVQQLHDQNRRLPFAIEVLGFADEEGLRFGSTYLGSRAVAGIFDGRDLDLVDSAGVTMADAIRAFGGDPSGIAEDRLSGELLGYCEVHIEQGPVLEARALPVGVVGGIAGQSRILIEFTGVAGHAGTVPMDRRRDALTAAAELVLAAEAAGAAQPGLVATVGRLEVEPGAANVIPGRTTLSLDVRHADDGGRLEGW